MTVLPLGVNFRAWLVIALLALVGLAGCATPEVVSLPPQPMLPFSESGEVIVPNRWWTEFNNAALNVQVERALGGNYSLAAALERLRAARAVTRREASDLFPDVDGLIDFDTTFGPGPNRTSTVWGLDAAYQVDLWGQIRSRVEAEQFRADATQDDYQAVALTLAAEVSRVWFSLIEAQAQLKLIGEQVESNRTGLQVLEWRFGRGLVRSPDVLRQRQLIESTLEQDVIVRARIAVLQHQLALLLGEPPQGACYTTGSQLPELPPQPATGLPSDLVLRRPDVRRDYLAFLAADRDLASAVSAQYPRLDVSGSVLTVAERPEAFFRDWFVSLGGGLIAPLLDGGQRRAEVERTSAVTGQRLNEYEQTKLIAFREVEDNLALERFQIQRIEKLNIQVTLAEQASVQLREQFLIGDASYLDVLSTIQSQQRLQRDILSARLNLILIRIGLYLALAGDFDTRPQPFAFPPTDTLELLPPHPEELPPPVEVAPAVELNL